MPTAQFFTLFLLLKCYVSDEELKLQGLVVTEGAGEARHRPDGMGKVSYLSLS